MPEGRYVEATAAVLVTLPGGEGRVMGTHLQLGLDPITAESIAVVGEALADLEG